MAGINTKTEPPSVLPPNNIETAPGQIITLHLGDGGEIWIGKNTGLVRFRPDTSPPDVRVYQHSDGFPVEHVEAIAQDIRHNLWVAVGTRGVVRIAAGSFELFTKADGLESVEVLGIVEGLRGGSTRLQASGRLMNFAGAGSFRSRFGCPCPGTLGR